MLLLHLHFMDDVISHYSVFTLFFDHESISFKIVHDDGSVDDFFTRISLSEIFSFNIHLSHSI